MNELYPIIRRQRRPLVETNAEMPKAETLKAEPQRVESRESRDESQKASDAKSATQRNQR